MTIRMLGNTEQSLGAYVKRKPWLSAALVLLSFSATQSLANKCDDPPGPSVDWQDCQIERALQHANLQNANLDGARLLGEESTVDSDILFTFDDVDFRGASMQGTRFGNDDDDALSPSTERLCFRNSASTFFDNQSSFYNQNGNGALFITGVGFISPLLGNGAGNIYGDGTCIPPERVRNPEAADIAPIRYAASVLKPWVRLSTNGASGYGYRERIISKAVTASSGIDTSYYAVDGIDEDNGWESVSEDSPWWEIDLGGHFRIEEIVIHARGDGDNIETGALKDAVVIVSDYPLAENSLSVENYDSASRFTVLNEPSQINSIQVQRTIRYLRIQKPPAGMQVLGFKSIKLNGHLTNTDDSSYSPDFPPPSTLAIDPYSNVPNECKGEMFDETEVLSCTFPWNRDNNSDYLKDKDENLNLEYCDVTDEILATMDLAAYQNQDSEHSTISLRHADLSGVDLTHANLTGIDLSHANLRGANLTGASLAYTIIRNADFRGAILDGVDFGSVAHHECALFSNELPLTLTQFDDTKDPPFAIPESSNVGYGYARQSSTDNNGVPKNAIDADDSSYSQTALEYSPWWELDLGAVHNVETIRFFIDVDEEAPFGYLEDAVVIISDWPFPNNPTSEVDTEIIAQYQPNIVLGSINEYQVHVGRSMRYVRIQKPDVGEERRLTLVHVKVEASKFPTAPSSFVPLTETQLDNLGNTGQLQRNMVSATAELKNKGPDSTTHDVSKLITSSAELRSLLERNESRYEKIVQLQSAIDRARQTVDALKVYKPLKKSPQLKKLEKVIEKAENISAKAEVAFRTLNNATLLPRYTLSKVVSSASSTRNQMQQVLRYLAIGEVYLEPNIRCALFDDGGVTYLSQLNIKIAPDVTHLQNYLNAMAQDENPRVRMRGHTDIVIGANSIIGPVESEIEKVSAEINAMADLFLSLFQPLVDIGDYLNTEIDLGITDLSAAEVLEFAEDVFNTIPGLSAAEKLVNDALEPLIVELMKPLDNIIPDFGFADIASLNSIQSLINEYHPSVIFPDPFDYNLPEFQADFGRLTEERCGNLAAPRLWPKDDEDLDGDGLTNGEELKLMVLEGGDDPYPGKLETLANSADTDLDGIGDYYEVTMARFVPTANNANGEVTADYDEDGLSNFEEFLAGSNPFMADSDSDGLPDKDEVAAGLNPQMADSDGDGTSDADEDTDTDGLTNALEVSVGMNIALALDADLDFDKDGISNRNELLKKTSINNSPPIAVNDNAVVDAGQIVSIDLINNDEPTDGDPLTLLSSQIVFPDRGQWTINNGIVQLDTGHAFDTLLTTEQEILQFVYRVTDAGGYDSAMVQVIVNGTDTSGGQDNQDDNSQDLSTKNTGAFGLIELMLLASLLLIKRAVVRNY